MIIRNRGGEHKVSATRPERLDPVYCRIGRGVLDSRSRAQPRDFLHFRWPAIWRRGFDVRDIDESRAIEAIRRFLDSPAARQRAVTAEWLAERLSLPLA